MTHESTGLGSDDRVGTWFGAYRVDSLIAEGGMGRVYLATAGDGTLVALKLVKEDLARDAMFRRRFQRETRAARAVHNRHVVPVRDAGEHDGIPYLAAQFIDGVALDRKLAQDAPLDLATTVRICSHVADGLQALWAVGMVHRDVKPANILLDPTGCAYLTDFGLAKVSDASALTRPGQPLGSMDYMSPEQIRGEPVTGAADVYSLGCVVYECLLGRPPFGDRDGLRVLWAHLQDEPTDPSAERHDLTPEVAQALTSALAKNPADRPRTSLEYARALSRAAGIEITDSAS